MALLSKKQSAPCSACCKICKWIVMLLLLVVSAASLAGVYQTHVVTGSDASRMMIQFGSTSGSLAIIAFVASVLAWGKKMACCMGGSCEACKK